MASYPIPGWIPGPQDVSGQFLGGVRAGAQIQQEQQRLAQEANLAEMRAMLEQQQNERDNALRQQQMAQTQEYNRAQISIRQQELAEQKKQNDIKTQDAARTYAAQQKFSEWVAQHPDEDPSAAYFKFFAGTTGMGTEAGTIARTMFQQRLASQPPQLTTYDLPGGRQVSGLLGRTGTGGFSFDEFKTPTEGVEGRMMRMEQRRELERRRDKLESSMTDADRMALANPKSIAYAAAKKKQDAIDALDKLIESAYRESGLPIPTENPLDTAPPSLPGPASTGGGAFKVIRQLPQSSPSFDTTPPGFGGAPSAPAPQQLGPPAPPPPQQLGPPAPSRPFSSYVPAVYRPVVSGAQNILGPLGQLYGAEAKFGAGMAAKGAKNAYRSFADLPWRTDQMMAFPSWLAKRMSDEAKETYESQTAP